MLDRIDTSEPRGIRDRAILETAYSTAVRRSELMGMNLGDLDLENGTIRVMGKGQRERMVPLGKQAVLWIRRYLDEVRPNGGDGSGVALWLGPRGTRLTAAAVQMALRMLWLKSGGTQKPIGLHCLRRACATHMLRNGAHPVEIQMLLGHSCLNHLRQYLQVSITDLQAAHAGSKPGQ
jgi:integrase/recombinase XerD